MPTVAEQLHQGREARHLSIEQIAEITKIRCDHLRALEQGNYSVFSAPVYIRGFVRTFSTVLKLDVPQVMAQLDTELGQSQQFAAPPALGGSSDGVLDFAMLQFASIQWRRGIVRWGVAVAACVLALALLAWRHYQKTDPLRGLKPATYQPARHNTAETLPLPSTPRK